MARSHVVKKPRRAATKKAKIAEEISPFADDMNALHAKLDMLLYPRTEVKLSGLENLAKIEEALNAPSLRPLSEAKTGASIRPSFADITKGFDVLLGEAAQLSDEICYLANRFGAENVFGEGPAPQPASSEEGSGRLRDSLLHSLARLDALVRQLRRTINALRVLEDGTERAEPSRGSPKITGR